jgi:hypothetical protein
MEARFQGNMGGNFHGQMNQMGQMGQMGMFNPQMSMMHQQGKELSFIQLCLIYNPLHE